MALCGATNQRPLDQMQVVVIDPGGADLAVVVFRGDSQENHKCLGQATEPNIRRSARIGQCLPSLKLCIFRTLRRRIFAV